MKTPKHYTENLKKRIITKEMLIDCLYSANKRAKNCRDKVWEFREMRFHNPYWYDKYHNIRNYTEKKEFYYKQKERLLSIIQPVCIHKEVFEEGRINYYLFYDLKGKHTFHKPIKQKYIKNWNLEIKDIDVLETHGEDINDLISNQFVEKVLELIKSKNYELILD